MKRFRTNETIQHLYFLYAYWGAIIMYGPLYKSVYQITMLFGSNFKKKKGLVKMTILMLIIGVSFGMLKLINSDYGYLIKNDVKPDLSKIYSTYYRSNKIGSDFLLNPEIQNEIISENTIKLFVPMFIHETDILNQQCISSKSGSENLNGQARQKIWKLNLDCYASSITLFLDNEKIKVDFLKTDHPITNQFGLQGFIDLAQISKGPHRLKIVKTVSSEIKREWEIPFYFSSNQ